MMILPNDDITMSTAEDRIILTIESGTGHHVDTMQFSLSLHQAHRLGEKMIREADRLDDAVRLRTVSRPTAEILPFPKRKKARARRRR